MASSAAKVGLFVILSLVLMGGAYVWLHGTLLREPTTPLTAEFDNAQGITAGTEVRLAGVRIGQVDKVEVSPRTRRALVHMRISGRQQVGPNDRITIATGGLLPAPYIEIIPQRPPVRMTENAYQGVEASTINDLLPQAQELMRSMNQVTQSVEELVGDQSFMRSVKQSATSIAASSKRGERIAANLEAMSRQGQGVVTNLQRASDMAVGTMAQARGVVGENRVKIARLLDQTTHSLGEIEKTLVEARGLIADEQTQEDLRTTLANVRETTATMREASETLRQTATDVQGLTGDAKLQEDLRATLSGARGTMEQAEQLLQRMNQIVGGGRGRTAGARQRVRDTDVRLEVQQSGDLGRPRVDANATIPGARGRFTRVGLNDLGEETKLNFQFGRPFQDGVSLRYGLHGSRLGMGLDWGSPARPRFSADLYGLDDTRLDLNAAVPLRPNLELTFGFERLFKQAAPTVGVRWHK